MQHQSFTNLSGKSFLFSQAEKSRAVGGENFDDSFAILFEAECGQEGVVDFYGFAGIYEKVAIGGSPKISRRGGSRHPPSALPATATYTMDGGKVANRQIDQSKFGVVNSDDLSDGEVLSAAASPGQSPSSSRQPPQAFAYVDDGEAAPSLVMSPRASISPASPAARRPWATPRRGREHLGALDSTGFVNIGLASPVHARGGSSSCCDLCAPLEAWLSPCSTLFNKPGAFGGSDSSEARVLWR